MPDRHEVQHRFLLGGDLLRAKDRNSHPCLGHRSRSSSNSSEVPADGCRSVSVSKSNRAGGRFPPFLQGGRLTLIIEGPKTPSSVWEPEPFPVFFHSQYRRI